ncbi:MAG: thioredoxin domain-containing protein, partial [Cyanobacteria bacterium]|nr:thioredoxin domain-containing protein [Cyanobacteriota bacterium]MDW8201657.1 thioredoxin domain-containing protein [Cyanobacteriota bacterium SKYGB_h_bin112]
MTSNPASPQPNHESASELPLSQTVRNLLIVIVAIVLSVAVFLGLRTQTTTVSLDALAARSIPLEIALKNGKPTLIEFYANWCTTCQAMAG